MHLCTFAMAASLLTCHMRSAKQAACSLPYAFEASLQNPSLAGSTLSCRVWGLSYVTHHSCRGQKLRTLALIYKTMRWS